MKRLGWAVGGMSALAAAVCLLSGPNLRGQQVLQFGFEGREPVWVQGLSDAPFKELAHRMTDEHAHGGQRSEFIQLQAEQGNFIHYTYDVGKAPVCEELDVSVWVRANRPGVRLLCRVVLPRERDPHNVDRPLTTIIGSDPDKDAYKLAGRWQQLALRQPLKRLREQEQLLRAELKRDVIVADAYVDQVILNVYGGPGLTEVWTDDLQVGPLAEAPRPAAAPVGRGGAASRAAPGRRAEARLEGSYLYAGGERFFMRAIRHTGTPLKTLADAGFNTVYLDESTPAGLVEDAARLGFWIVPRVAPPASLAGRPETGPVEGQLTSGEIFGRKVSRFTELADVLCWDLGSTLTFDRLPAVSRAAQAFRSVDPARPVSADVWDGLQAYPQTVNQLMLGAHRAPLMTSLELTSYRDWLTQRRHLAPPGTFCWTWIQTHLDDWATTVSYDRTSAAGPITRTAATETAPEPQGPQAEQIKLMAYTAIGAGYRGLGFWSDRSLADSHTGRDRLLALAQLNQELKMLEPLLVTAQEPAWIDTSNPQVKAAVIRTLPAKGEPSKGLLVLPLWIGGGAQFVPGQSATAELSMVVPQVPGGAEPWEVSPGQVRKLPWKRKLGGVEVTLHEFSLAQPIVFTSDLTGLVVRWQDLQRDLAPVAAQWAHDQAEEELTKVERINGELEQLGRRLPDAQQLLDKARGYLTSCQNHRRDGNHAEAYAEAERALRPLRILMRAHWEKAVREMGKGAVPVSSPYAVSFFTLPRHYRFLDQIQQSRVGGNVLPDGDFELPPSQVPQGWLVQDDEPPAAGEAPPTGTSPVLGRVPAAATTTAAEGTSPILGRVPGAATTTVLDKVVKVARRVTEEHNSGAQSLMLKVTAKDPALPPAALERTFLAIHSPAVRLEPGTLVRISAWVKVPSAVTASTDGVLLYDSAGGEPLAVRLTQATKGWEQVTLYRRVPPSGSVNVTMALTGLGTAYFDDVRVEPLLGRGAPVPMANR
jgi:hypothetical protein